MSPTRAFTLEYAQSKLEHHIQHTPFLKGASIAIDKNISLSGFFAFSVLPEVTGLSGEIVYLVNADSIYTSGNEHDFEHVVKGFYEKGHGIKIDAGAFALLFTRFMALRRGVILNQKNGHPLLNPESIPEKLFTPPIREQNGDLTLYKFWFFDTVKLQPAQFEVSVNQVGKTTAEVVEYNN